MKALNELNFPEDVAYSKEHTWARLLDGQVQVGILTVQAYRQMLED